jgi:hypothetical protein
MPRRRIPNVSVPGRLDRRRRRDNGTDAQHRPPRGRRGQVETIAGRRVIALQLRRGGASYREVAELTKVDVATAYADVRAELAALREQTVEEAKELRDLELQRFDEMTAGLWPQVRAGSPTHVTAAVRVAERRARLLGLDEPVVTKNELSGALSVSAQKYAAEKELFLRLPIEQLEALAREHQALLDRAFSMARAHGVKLNFATARDEPLERGDDRDASDPMGCGANVARSGDGHGALDQDGTNASVLPVRGSPSLVAVVEDVVTGKPAEPSTASTLADERNSGGTEPTPRETP